MTTTVPNTAEGFVTDEIVARANECLTMMSAAALTNHDEFPEAVGVWREEIQRALDLIPSHLSRNPRRDAIGTTVLCMALLASAGLVVFVVAKLVMAATV